MEEILNERIQFYFFDIKLIIVFWVLISYDHEKNSNPKRSLLYGRTSWIKYQVNWGFNFFFQFNVELITIHSVTKLTCQKLCFHIFAQKKKKKSVHIYVWMSGNFDKILAWHCSFIKNQSVILIKTMVVHSDSVNPTVNPNIT